MKRRIQYINFNKEFPTCKGGPAFRAWFQVNRMCDGRIIHIHIKHHAIKIDLR